MGPGSSTVFTLIGFLCLSTLVLFLYLLLEATRSFDRTCRNRSASEDSSRRGAAKTKGTRLRSTPKKAAWAKATSRSTRASPEVDPIKRGPHGRRLYGEAYELRASRALPEEGMAGRRALKEPLRRDWAESVGPLKAHICKRHSVPLIMSLS